jgi:hypothetical protein
VLRFAIKRIPFWPKTQTDLAQNATRFATKRETIWPKTQDQRPSILFNVQFFNIVIFAKSLQRYEEFTI